MRAAALLLLCASCAGTREPGTWHPLTEGEWQATLFGGEGEVHLEGDSFVLHRGEPLTGVTFTQPIPEGDYELALEATKLEGHDFFVGLTFPVADSHLTLVLGGWGGALCGLSCIDGDDASGNETKFFEGFDDGREYAVRLLVEGRSVRVQVDGEEVIDFDSTGHELSLRTEVEPCRPLGIATFLTKARIRNLRWRSR